MLVWRGWERESRPRRRMSGSVRYSIGVDIGGTFTDIVLLASDGTVETAKVPSTVDDYSRGIAAGIAALLDRLEIAPDSVDGLVHATTVAANTILEHKGARTGLVTTRGFRDILEMRRLRIPVMYDLQYDKPPPLVPRRRRFEVTERMGPRGEVWQALDLDEVATTAHALAGAEVDAVAVSLLHAYANPAHEQRVAEILRAHLGTDVFITTSAEILPEIREYERTSTAVVNAYIGPVVDRYIGALDRRLRDVGLSCPIRIMLSSGGVMTVDMARRRPAALVESGPAAGVIACARVARAASWRNVISFDMGGTTAKAAIIENGQIGRTNEYEVGAGINLSSRLVKGGGYPIKLPFVDASEIGAGGGSIVTVDDRGRVRVGPESAGAEPGPVCYDRGGSQPTLTDALVALGYINPDHLLGGGLLLDAPKAKETLERALAAPLGMTLHEAAHGVLTIACTTMTRAVKAVSTHRGRDPREFVLVAFGGNGPVVAAEIARTLGMRRVLVPPAPGVFSSLGLLFSDIEHEVTQTVLGRWPAVTTERVAAVYRVLEGSARGTLREEGCPEDEIVLERCADLRYKGQAYELTVPVADGTPDPERLARDFIDEHERTYGHRSDIDPVDLVTLKVTARVAAAEAPSRAPVDRSNSGASGGARDVYFGHEAGVVRTPILNRADLAGHTLDGPLIVEEYDATCVIPPGGRATLDAFDNIDVTLEMPA